MRLLHVVGARPNFMKVAPVLRALADTRNIRQIVVHTGQHYDKNMSDVFFDQLGIPAPDINLGIGSGTHAEQTAQTMLKFEQTLSVQKPDRVIVYGDINSTVAAAMVCAKLSIPIDHVEAGLRSGDRSMPEEVNRLVTDRLASLLFTPSTDGDANLLREGVDSSQIHFVGNVMIDTLIRMLPYTNQLDLQTPKEYILVTLHRPSNTDNLEMLQSILSTLAVLSCELPVIFPIHPRTRKQLSLIDFRPSMHKDLQLWDPVGYLEFLSLQQKSSLVITDSGGIQEETTYLQVPCLTIRENTERPITVTVGTNQLVGQDMQKLRTLALAILNGSAKKGSIPEKWDGHAGERIAGILGQYA